MKHYDVDPEKLTRVFDNTTSTYKFYWCLALLQQVKEGKAYSTITFTEMVAAMVAKSWNSVTSGTFNFGDFDKLIHRTNKLIKWSELNAKDVEERVERYIVEHADSPLIKDLVDKMTKYVPYRFLYPWIGTMSNAKSAAASQDFNTYRCPYSIRKNTININPAWVEYLQDHLTILEAFTKYNLQFYLINHNNKILLADNEAITADGASSSMASQMGMACDTPPAYGKDHTISCLQATIKEKEKQLKLYSNMFKQISSIITLPQNTMNFVLQLEHNEGDNLNFYSGSQNVGTINRQENNNNHKNSDKKNGRQ